MQVDNNALFVIRYYDGKARANGETGNWKDVPADGTLQAGTDDQFTLYVDNVCFIIQRTDDGECIPARSEFVAIYGPEGDDKFRMSFVYNIQDVLVIVQGRRDGSQAGDFLYIIAFIKWVVTVG